MSSSCHVQALPENAKQLFVVTDNIKGGHYFKSIRYLALSQVILRYTTLVMPTTSYADITIDINWVREGDDVDDYKMSSCYLSASCIHNKIMPEHQGSRHMTTRYGWITSCLIPLPLVAIRQRNQDNRRTILSSLLHVIRILPFILISVH